MDVELIEIREFLASYPPFSQLPAPLLDTLPARLTIRYLRRGTSLPDELLAESAFMVRSGAIELRDRSGNLVDKLGEGDLTLFTCSTEITPEKQQVANALEDTLLYQLPCSTLLQLRAQHPDFAAHFEEKLHLRLHQALVRLQQESAWHDPLADIPLSTLLLRTPVSLEGTATIRQAAEKMSHEGVSSLLLTRGEKLCGIVTDRDLRNRCLAAGVAPDEPVESIMTAAPFTLSAELSAQQAQLEMTRRNIHHLPIVDRKGELLGLITSSDLMQQHRLDSVGIATAIRRAEDIDTLAELSSELAELQLRLQRSGVDAGHINATLSLIGDTLTERLIEIAEKKLGPPPHPYAWIVCGSQARNEQVAHTDQDNALIIADGLRCEDEAYFAQLATLVSDGLARCGFSYCPGEVMASNPKWRQTLSKWIETFNGWIDTPEPAALMHASIFFDMRTIHGERALVEQLRSAILPRGRDNTIFLAHMTANALSHRPPLGFFRQFVLVHDGEHDDTLDLKKRGIIPIVDLARVYALSAALPQLSTLERLKAAATAGVLSSEGAEDLKHAFEFIATLRLRHQAEQQRQGKPLDNFLPPRELSPLEREQLKETFALIHTMQEALSQRFQSERIG